MRKDNTIYALTAHHNRNYFSHIFYVIKFLSLAVHFRFSFFSRFAAISTYPELRHRVTHPRPYHSKHHHEHHLGPFFEEPLNATSGALLVGVHLATEAVLNCRVGMLKDKTVNTYSNLFIFCFFLLLFVFCCWQYSHVYDVFISNFFFLFLIVVINLMRFVQIELIFRSMKQNNWDETEWKIKLVQFHEK